LEKYDELVSNPWVIGILGGIPSGFVVNWISRYALGKREDREYLQKLFGANREVIYAIRPGISEGLIPSANVLEALIHATPRRFDVETSDLYTSKQIAEELVKEVMDSSFISSAQKTEYCNHLAELGEAAAKDERVKRTEERETQPRTITEYRTRLVSSMSMFLGLLTATTTMMFSILELIRSKKLNLNPISDQLKLSSLLPAFSAMLTIAVTTLAFVVYRDLARRRSVIVSYRYRRSEFDSVERKIRAKQGSK
jgi:hypothetical protein